MHEAYIYDAVRTPRGRGRKDGALYGIKSVSLLSTVLEALRERNHLDTSLVEDLIIGCVTQVGEQSGDVAKSAAIVVGGQGRGRIICFLGDLNFRAFWFGTNRLFANAVFFGNLINSDAVEKK